MVKRRSIIQPYSATTPVDEVTQIGSGVTFLVTQADHPNEILRRVRVNDTGGEFSELVAGTGTAATTYTDNTVAASTHYTYHIKAINEHGVSERSRWFHIETLEVPVPAKPTGLNATATHDQVALTWDDPGDYSITGYVILRRHRYDDPKGHFDELVADTGTAATTYTDDTVEDSTHYTYRIKAINEYGGERALRQVVLRRVLPELEVQRRLLVDGFQLVVELDHVLVRRLVGAVGMLSPVFLPPFRILVPVIEVLIQLDSVPVIHLFPCCHSLIPCGFSRSLSTVLATNLFYTGSFVTSVGSGKGLCWVPECKEVQHIAANSPWCQSRWRLARGWFAILAANSETRTEEPRWDSKTGGDIGNRHGGVAFDGTPCTVALGARRRTLEIVVRYACWNL